LTAGDALVVPPRTTAIGSLIHYLVSADSKSFQPENINFGIMPSPEGVTRRIGKKEKHLLQTRRALEAMAGFRAQLQRQPSRAAG
jgi:methylenetetrahydrofolate--tRNA-(uracil-5-)-methyltransferase